MENVNGFKKAKAVWLKEKQLIMNVQASFKANFYAEKTKKYTLYITGSTLYRIYINGSFLHYGPARAAHGYTRIDEISIDKYIINGNNKIFVEVAGYNIGTYYTLDIPSFIQFEIVNGSDNVIYHTDDDEPKIQANEIESKVRKTVRYSFQRSFSEIYHLNNNNEEITCDRLELVHVNLKYLNREVPYPKYEIKGPAKVIEEGCVIRKHKDKGKLIKVKHINEVSDEIQGYKYEDIREHPFELLQECEFVKDNNDSKLHINSNRYVLFDMGLNNVGFIKAKITVLEDSEVYFFFDEKLIDDKIDINTWSSTNILKYTFKKSEKPYVIESFECYGFKYIQCFVLKGSIVLDFEGIREYSYPNYSNTEFICNDEKINTIYKAAIETYRQNTLDVFMDCPSRERAGWLCDSYFTSKAEEYFSGNYTIEKVMLENYIIVDKFKNIPEGMLPMCYPADQTNGNFIPQWAMWYVIELDEYFQRNIYAKKNTYKKLCYKLVVYFNKYLNSDGLLEKLDRWCFIEWSDANKYVQDVHYPTNMMYHKVLELIGNWYKDETLLEQSKAIKKTVINQSFNGTFFIDNAIRDKEGKLHITHNVSEVCQYYALFFGIASINSEKYDKLNNLVFNVFGPNRKKQNIMPEIVYANSFIGNYLRMEILLKHGYYKKIIKETKDYFYYMAVTTGTLWENDCITTGSLNHGFASYIGVVLVKCLLGIKRIDIKNKLVVFDFKHKGIEASGKVGTVFGNIIIERKLVNGELKTNYTVPIDLKCIVE